MPNLINFKEYYNSRQQLKEALDNEPIKRYRFSLNKYCKIPIIENEEKSSISLKPKDIIEVLFEGHNSDRVIEFVCNDKKIKLSWSSEKIRSWISANTNIIRT